MLHTPAPAALACLDAVALASGELVRLIGATSTPSTITLGQRMSSDSELEGARFQARLVVETARKLRR